MGTKTDSNVKALLTRIMDTAARKLKCDKGTLYLYDEHANQLWTVVFQSDAISTIRIEPPAGLAGYSFWHKKVVNVEDAHESPYFKKDIDDLTKYRTRSVLCMPVPDKAGKPLGVAQMINKSDGTPFNDDDIKKMGDILKEITDVLDTSDTWPALMPGLLLACAVAVLGWAAHFAVPAAYKSSVSPVLFVVLIGIAVSNLLILPMRYLPGIRYTMRQLLRLGIVLMGAKLALDEVARVGAHALALIVALIVLAFAIAQAAGKIFGVHRRLAALIAVGTAVCGGSAIAAVAPAIKARDEEFSFAISVNTLMGTLAVFSFPLIGRYFGFDDQFFGLWAGTAVNDTAQVLATGYAYSVPSGDTATIIKLTRNTLMIFVVVAVALYFSSLQKEDGVDVKKIPFKKRLRESIPDFVLGFLLLALLNTLGVFAWLSAQSGLDVPKGLSNATNVLILVSLAGIGLGTSLAKVRQVGMNAIAVSFLTFAGAAGGSVLLIGLIGR